MSRGSCSSTLDVLASATEDGRARVPSLVGLRGQERQDRVLEVQGEVKEPPEAPLYCVPREQLGEGKRSCVVRVALFCDGM